MTERQGFVLIGYVWCRPEDIIRIEVREEYARKRQGVKKPAGWLDCDDDPAEAVVCVKCAFEQRGEYVIKLNDIEWLALKKAMPELAH